LTTLRVERELTQQQLAEKLGVSSGAVSLVESGKRVPSYELMTKWLALFDLKPEDRPDIINSISEQIKATRKRGEFERLASGTTLSTQRVAISIAVDDLVRIVHTDLEGISTAKLSKQAVSDIRACIFKLAENLVAAS